MTSNPKKSSEKPLRAIDPESKLFASWHTLTAGITDPQARAKGVSELVAQLDQIKRANKEK
jgi:hypothetical protein